MSRPEDPSPVWRIRDRRSFAEFRRRGVRGRHGPVTVTFVPDAGGAVARVAYAVGRPVGTAVARNRLRRRLRAVVRELAPPPGAYLVGAAAAASALPYDELTASVRAAMDAAVRRAGPSTP